jgi:hypothetical protein
MHQVFAICIFTSPIGILVAIFVFLWRKNSAELHRFSAWAAIVSGLVSPSIGLWGLAHLDRLRLREYWDFGFERRAGFYADIAVLLALAWLVRSRRWYSWVVFVVALAVSINWILVLSTL